MILDVSVAGQTVLFLKSMLLGACLMLLYDAFRILRMAAPMPAWAVLVQDIVFFAACAVATFLFLVSANDGEVRLFTLLGEALGALLCALTVSQVVMACSKAIHAAVRAVLRFVWKVFLRPVYLLLRMIAGLIVRVSGFFGGLAKKSLRRAEYGLKRRRILLYNLIKHRAPKGAGDKKPDDAGN